MPEGWRSISVPEEVYSYFREKWEEKKQEYKIKYGVTSFSGFVSRILYELIEQEKLGTQKRISL